MTRVFRPEAPAKPGCAMRPFSVEVKYTTFAFNLPPSRLKPSP
jgi:hypothetical protein